MKLSKYFGYGVSVFIFGFLTTVSMVAIFGRSSSGPINSLIFNAAMMGLIISILFLSAVIVVCTLIIINTLKNKQ